MSLRVAVGIPTHNRLADLRSTFAELDKLDPQPDEIVVVVDGCTDGTLEWLQTERAGVKVVVNSQAVGCVEGRNQIARATTCDVLIGIDDDSHPIETDFIAHVRGLFADRPKLAVASFAQRTNEFPASLTASDFGPSYFAGSYVNCASAVRPAVFLAVGGYPDFFRHMYDEPDLSLRVLAAGWQIFHDTSRTVRHHYSPKERSEIRNHHRHARNELWSVLMRCPWPWLPLVALYRAATQARYAATRGLAWAVREPLWWGQALAGVGRCREHRRVVPWARYRAWMRAVRKPMATEQEWARNFGEVAP